MVWARARLIKTGISQGSNPFVCNELVNKIEHWMRQEEDPAANCDWEMWRTRFETDLTARQASHRAEMERLLAEEEERKKDRTFKPSMMSDRIKVWLMGKRYKLDEPTVDQILLNTYRFAPKRPIDDPRRWLASVIMNAETNKYNHDSSLNKHWFGIPGQGVLFMTDFNQLCFERHIEIEERMDLLAEALDCETPYYYAGREAEARDLYTQLIDSRYPAIPVTGTMPDTEAASLSPTPPKAKVEAPTPKEKKMPATNLPHWTETAQNGAFWGGLAKDLEDVPNAERAKFVHDVILDKWGWTSIKQAPDPETVKVAVLEAYRLKTSQKAPEAKLAPLPPQGKPSAPPAPESYAENEPSEDDGDSDEGDLISVVPGKTVSPFLTQSKTLTGIPALELKMWLNKPHDDRFYKAVQGAGGANWSDLAPFAVQRRLNKVFGPQGVGWKVVPSVLSKTESIPTKTTVKGREVEAYLVVMSDYTFMYRMDTPAGFEWMEVGGIGASDVKTNHKWAMHGANTGLMKRALAVLGGYDHFKNPGEED